MMRLGTIVRAFTAVGAGAVGVSFSQQLPFQTQAEPPVNVAAKVLRMEGRVSVLRDSSPWALSVGDTVAPRQIIVTGPDGHAVFEVDDGSTFQVFPNSKVAFRPSAAWMEMLEVWLGQVKVHVQRWGGRPNQQKIATPTAVVSVRGTTFDVLHEADESTVVSVEEGQVAVSHRLIVNERPRLLNGGEQLRVYKNVPLAKARVDKGNLLRRGLDAMADAVWTAGRTGRLPGSGGPGGAPGGGSSPVPSGGGAGGPVGDTEATPPPPPPPPPPPI